MKTTDYCDYKLSIALKACGFDEPCEYYYTSKGRIVFNKNKPPYANNRFLDEIGNEICSAVPLWHAQKWLRERHHLHVNISTYGERSWTTNINGWNKEDIPVGYLHPVNVQTYDTYEQALSAGISAALELIKKGE